VNCSAGVAWTVASDTGVWSVGSGVSVGAVGEYPPHAASATIASGARSLDAPREIVCMGVVLSLFLVGRAIQSQERKRPSEAGQNSRTERSMRRAAQRTPFGAL